MGSHFDTGIPGEKVRLILGDAPAWQNATAGHALVTDEKGEAVFTMDVKLDKTFIWQNAGFTPFSLPVRAEHLQISVELPPSFPARKRRVRGVSLGADHGRGSADFPQLDRHRRVHGH